MIDNLVEHQETKPCMVIHCGFLTIKHTSCMLCPEYSTLGDTKSSVRLGSGSGSALVSSSPSIYNLLIILYLYTVL